MRTRNLVQSLAGLLACGIIAAPALAAPVRDLKFMKNAAQDGMFEVQMGQIAEHQGGARGVRQFGMQMVRDHSQANHDLMRIASQEGVVLPKDIGPENRAIKVRLSRLQGAAFDAAYTKAMIAGHTKDLMAFRREASHGKNPPVRAFADKYQTVIQGHLMMALGLRRHGGRMGT